MAGKGNSNSGTAVAPARAKSPAELALAQADTPEKFRVAVSKMFGVRPNEVALLRLEKGLLKFVFPDQLKTAGSIPVSSSSSVAAHTASTKKTELFNTFAKVKHARVFETVRLGTTEESDHSEQTSIQKLMSAPILNPQKKVLGVIQICRKGFELASSGPDFTLDDLQQLEAAARVAASLPFLQESTAK
jgi:GAF domain-containing protein